MRASSGNTAAALCLGALAIGVPADGQVVSGRVIDSANGAPVPTAAVLLLDRDRDHVGVAMADSIGRYLLAVPDSGEYFLIAQRFGYLDLESPLLAISSRRDYALDLEMQPEPLGLGGMTVTVRNEDLVEWLTLELGSNPAAAFGFRVLQGARLEAAKVRAAFDPTWTLRWLYVPISHGRCVSINALERPEAVSWFSGPRAAALDEPGAPPAGTRSAADRRASVSGREGGCGTLLLNDRVIPNERIDTIDMSSIAVVVTLPGSVRLYTYDFDWTFRGR